MPMPSTSATAGYAESPFGQIHYVEAGSGEPVLLLHQTPRSVDEYRDVVLLLGRSFRTIAGVAAVDHKPTEFAAVVEAFLTSHLSAQPVSGA